MAQSKLSVTITSGDYTEVAKSTNLRTIQKCLSLIAEETLENPPSREAVELEAVEREKVAIAARNYDLDRRVKELEKLLMNYLEKKTMDTNACPTAESAGVPKGDLFA
jgi:hypothetical protein